MKLEVLQEDFSTSLAFTQRFVSTRATLPILSNIALDATNGKLSIMATNLEASVSRTLGAKIKEEGQISVNAKVLTEVIANLSKGPLSIESEKEGIRILSSGFSGKIAGLNFSEFPAIPREISKNAMGLDFLNLRQALSYVLFSASRDETRPILTGVLFIFEKEKLYLVSSDGFRLSRVLIKTIKPEFEKKVTIPRNVLSEIIKIPTTQTKLFLDFKEDENQALFSLSDTVIASRVIEGEFPDFEKIIPKTIATKVFVDKESLSRALKIASAFARDSSNIIKIAVREGSVQISSQSAMAGEQKTKIDAKVEGPDLTISYNYRFLEEFLTVCEDSEVEIDLNDSSAPGIFKDNKNPNFLHLIMPVKI